MPSKLQDCMDLPPVSHNEWHGDRHRDMRKYHDSQPEVQYGWVGRHPYVAYILLPMIVFCILIPLAYLFNSAEYYKALWVVIAILWGVAYMSSTELRVVISKLKNKEDDHY